MALVAVGVSGGISAYKAVEVVRQLQKAGHQVAVVMTRAATRFVGPLTFEAITQRKVITSQWAAGANADIEHIALASEAALLLVARWWQDEDQDCFVVQLLHLAGAIHLDLQHDIATVGNIGRRGAVVVVEELGPLQEAAGGDATFELGMIGEDVRGVRFARPLCARRP